MVFDVNTESKLQYKYFPTHTQALKFRVKASRDANVAITDNPKDANHAPFVLKIGAWGNSKVYLEKNGKTVEEVKSPPKLKGDRFVHFWITWYNRTIKFGTENSTTPILRYKDEQVPNGDFFGVATDGVTGSWKLDDRWSGWPSDASETVEWVPESNGHVPKDAIVGGYDGVTGLYYVGRRKTDWGQCPGKVHPASGEFHYIGQDMLPFHSKDYEVLCGGTTSWILASNGDVPPNAVVAGRTNSGEPMFMGRAPNNWCVEVGTVMKSQKALVVVLKDEKVKKIEKYEVLCS